MHSSKISHRCVCLYLGDLVHYILFISLFLISVEIFGTLRRITMILSMAGNQSSRDVRWASRGGDYSPPKRNDQNSELSPACVRSSQLPSAVEVVPLDCLIFPLNFSMLWSGFSHAKP